MTGPEVTVASAYDSEFRSWTPDEFEVLRTISGAIAGVANPRAVASRIVEALGEAVGTWVALLEVEAVFGRVRIENASGAPQALAGFDLGIPVASLSERTLYSYRRGGLDLLLCKAGEARLIACGKIDSENGMQLLLRGATAVKIPLVELANRRLLRRAHRRLRSSSRLLAAPLRDPAEQGWWKRLAEEAMLASRAEWSWVAEVRPRHLQVAGVAGKGGLRFGDVLEREVGIAGWVLTQGHDCVVGSLSDGTGTRSLDTTTESGLPDFESAVVVPIRDTEGRVVAVLGAHSGRPFHFDAAAVADTVEVALLGAMVLSGRADPIPDLIDELGADFVAAVLDAVPEGVAAVDGDGLVRYCNGAFARMHGSTSPDDLIGRPSIELERQGGRAVALGRDETRRRLDGSRFLAEVRRVPLAHASLGANGVLMTVRDVSDRARVEATARHAAKIDPLTGLRNRAGFFQEAVAAFGPSESAQCGLVFIDLDGLKAINDQFGHDVGDVVLGEVGNRIRANTRPSDIVGRIGGDEFVVFSTNIGSARSARAFGERLAREISGYPVAIGDLELVVTAAVGVGWGDSSASTLDQLLSMADSAMYSDKFARRKPGSQVVPLIPVEAVDVGLGPDLVGLIRGDERAGALVLNFQPVFDVPSARVHSVEALIRWRHPREGLLMPARFLPLALQSRLLDELDSLVRADAFARFGKWRTGGIAPGLELSVNLSGMNAGENRTVRDFCRMADENSIPRGSILIELTETELPDVLIDKIARMIRRLKAEGFRIALDDFGVRSSSLRHLQMMPVDVVKIDRQFVKDLGSGGNVKLVAALAALAEGLGLDVIAEGVGDEETVKVLGEMGITLMQGFHFSKPVGEGALLKLLSKG